MSITLTPEQEKLVQAQLQTGRFSSAEEVIQYALQLLGAGDLSMPQKQLRITPAIEGSGYADTAINHDLVLADRDPESKT